MASWAQSSVWEDGKILQMDYGTKHIYITEGHLIRHLEMVKMVDFVYA